MIRRLLWGSIFFSVSILGPWSSIIGGSGLLHFFSLFFPGFDGVGSGRSMDKIGWYISV